jgi:hypothetical protein
MQKRRWLIALHVVVLIYVLPAFFLAGGPPVGNSLVSSYRQSVVGVVGVLVVLWNFAYWFKGFYPRIYRLSPRVQAETGARVCIKGRSGIGWDRPVGWQASFGLQVRFLGLVLAAFALWGVMLITAICIMGFLHDGPTAVAKFLGR